jgi:hypothetical protein
MKAYVITTGAVFGLLTLAHIWRILAEERHLATDPFFMVVTLITAALCLWAARLLWLSRRP